MTEQEVLEFIEENDVKFIRLAFADLFGTMKNISIQPAELARAFESGVGFDAMAVKGFCDAPGGELFLKPDLGTLTVLPWRPQTGRVARMMCDCVTGNGQFYNGSSRAILRRQAEAARSAGYLFCIGTEYEFYLFKSDEQGDVSLVPQDRAGYMDVSPLDQGENIRREICLTLEAMHIQPECSHHEQGPGQNEIDFRYAGALTAADNAMSFKGAVRTIASLYGLHASFMPKPLEHESGNGMHVNLSILKDGRNVFENEDGKLSDDAQHAVAGILRRIREMSLFLNPLPSSYQRLGKCEAPDTVSWSFGNRSQCIRIPEAKQDHARMELRSPDPACNPYLAYALIIAAAMEGIREKTALQPPVRETGHLPRTLGEAIHLAENSAFVRTVIPEEILKLYLSEKKKVAQRDRDDHEAVFHQHLRTI